MIADGLTKALIAEEFNQFTIEWDAIVDIGYRIKDEEDQEN